MCRPGTKEEGLGSRPELDMGMHSHEIKYD